MRIFELEFFEQVSWYVWRKIFEKIEIDSFSSSILQRLEMLWNSSNI